MRRLSEVAVLVVLTASAWGCGEKTAPVQGTSVVSVRVGSPVRREVAQRIEAAADVLPENKVVIMPEVSGVIAAIVPQEGDRVTKGQVIVEIEDRDYRNGVAQAEAALAAARAQSVGAQRTFEVVKTQFERMEKLRESNSISQGAYDEVSANYAQARAASLASEAQLKAAEAQLSTARAMLDDCRITAPFDGYAADRFEDPGAVVQTMPPTAIMLLVQVDPVRIQAHVPESQLARLSPGMTADILLDAFGGERFQGEIRAVLPTVDPVSRNGTVEVRLSNPDGRIRPGMSARLSVETGVRSYLTAPRSALLTTVSDRESELYVVASGNRAERRKVVLDGYLDEHALVVSGLAEGDRFVARGAHSVSEGVELEILSESEGAEQ